MKLYELDTGWARTEDQRRYLRWELFTCADVVGVFSTARDDVLAVLFSGDRISFDEWARSFRPSRPHFAHKGEPS
ncbi:MAG TPA: hypothetical protein VKR23_06850 [Gaiellaceae bacterium]|nr:hypothetical protein [Gaiellaceae bacterium]